MTNLTLAKHTQTYIERGESEGDRERKRANPRRYFRIILKRVQYL
jgi:hypothetical protein